jgi:DMSO/TMAO reductase YedYZ heme-binding membrane subunit
MMRPNERKVGINNNVMIIVGVVTILAYLSLGFWFALSERPLFNISMKTQRILGLVCIFYGFFRTYILYSRYFKKPKRNFDDLENQ